MLLRPAALSALLGIAALVGGCEVPSSEGVSAAAIARSGFYCEEPSAADSLDPLSPNALTFAKLKELIVANRIRSVDQLLAYFAGHPVYRGFLDNPVLNKRSNALHAEDVSAAFPRLVLHQHRMVMMMVTDTRKLSSQQLEIIEYVPEDHRYEFRLINFAVFGQPTMFVERAGNTAFSFRDGNELVRLPPFTDPSFEGVQACGACHDRALSGYYPWLDDRYLLPRWSVAPIWNPAFGGRSHHEDPAQWARFEATYASTTLGQRFRSLPPIRVERSDGDVYFPDRPNLALANHFNRMNFHRIASYLTESPRWAGLEFATVAAFLGCDDLPGFLPDPYAAAHPAVGGVATPATLIEHAANGDLEPFVSEEPLVEKLQYLFGKSVLQYWGSAEDAIYSGRVRDASFSSSEGGLPGLMACELGPAFLAAHPDLNRFAKSIVDARYLEVPKAEYCGVLRERSRAAIASQPWAADPGPPPGLPYTLGFLADCSVYQGSVEVVISPLSAPAVLPPTPRRLDGKLAITFFDARHNPIRTDRQDLHLTLKANDPRRTLRSTTTARATLCDASFEPTNP